MVRVFALSAVDRGFEPHSDQIKDCKIGMYCSSGTHVALRRKSKYWFARNWDNVSDSCDMATRGLFQ